MLQPDDRMVVLMHGGLRGNSGKTGLALLRYSRSQIVAALDQESAGQCLADLTGIDRDVPIVADLNQALVYSPNVLAIGLAPSGGSLVWQQEVEQAIAAGLSIINGLHTPLGNYQLKPGQWLWHVRRPPAGLNTIGSGKAKHLACRRILTVGTDMAIGKMSTSLELEKAALARGLKAKFLATGQTGIMLSGEGIPLDAIAVDFAAGAVEQLVLEGSVGQDIVFIEGQGSLLHPGSTATLPLLRGSQPTGLVLVHRWGQTAIHNCPDFLIPPLPVVVQMYNTISLGAQIQAIALNTAQFNEIEAREAIATVIASTKLPCTDPIRFGADPLLDALL